MAVETGTLVVACTASFIGGAVVGGAVVNHRNKKVLAAYEERDRSRTQQMLDSDAATRSLVQQSNRTPVLLAEKKLLEKRLEEHGEIAHFVRTDDGVGLMVTPVAIA